MVTIQEIRLVRSLACVCLDSGEKYWLRHEDLPTSGLKEGMEYEPEALYRQIRLLQYPRALNLAVAMLARRPCSKGEIRSKLIIRRFSEEVADLVILKLEKENLLNDEDFCEQWIRCRLSRNYGPSLIRRELRLKGIPDELICLVMERFPEESCQENAVLLARKAWKRVGPDAGLPAARQKVIAALVRKGYDWDTARSACETAEKEQ